MAILAGIARHAAPHAPMEVLEAVNVTVDGGLDGDCRGPVRRPGKNRRQVSLIETRDWDAAMAEIGGDLRWWHRRANLLVRDFDLPQGGDVRVRIGNEVVLAITQECNPCFRMDRLVAGLKDALRPDWRGGALAAVIAGGTISVGDAIGIER